MHDWLRRASLVVVPLCAPARDEGSAILQRLCQGLEQGGRRREKAVGAGQLVREARVRKPHRADSASRCQTEVSRNRIKD